MKNLFKALVCTMLLASASAFAAGNQQIVESSSIKTGIYFSKDGKLNINIENSLEKKTKIQIVDSNNQVVFQENQKNPSRLSKLKVDVNQLPDGTYTIQVSNGKDTINQNVQLETPRKERIRIVGK